MTVTVSYSRDSLHPEFRSNSFTFDHQLAPDLVGRPDGQFVSAYATIFGPIALEWYSPFDSAPSGLPRFPAEGATLTTGDMPSLTQLHNGNTLVVWDENDAGDPGIKGRLYDSNGVAIGGELALINGTAPFIPRVAGLRDGGFALTYRTDAAVAVALFDDNGNGSILPGTIPAAPATELAITPLSDGGFVVTRTHGAGFFSQELYGRVYNADGSVRRADFLIEGAGFDFGRFLGRGNAAGLPNGNWAVVWEETGDLGGSTGVRLKIFNPAGDPVTSGFIQVNAPSLAHEQAPDIAVLPNGFIVVGWSRSGDISIDVQGRIFDQNGNPIDLGEFALSSGGFLNRMPALAAVGPSGQFVTSWQDFTSDGSGGRITSVVSELVRHSSGDGADDTLIGDALNDMMQGGGGNDSFRAGGGINFVNGAAGNDTAAYDLALASYAAYQDGARLIVIRPTDDGVALQGDILSGIEQLQFADGRLAADDGNGVFDTFFYMAQNPDVFHAGVDAIAHYNAFGWREGRDPSEFFDTSAYLAANPDVAAAGVNPLGHYHASGWREGRDPSVLFDTTYYLMHSPDVAAAGVDPLEHFLTFGLVEGRPFAPAVGTIVSGFDAQYYLMHNPDVAAAGVDALTHFRTFGWREGRDPNGWFDTSAYLSHYGDVAAAGVNPLDHYMTLGWREGRSVSDRFHTVDYLAANPDVAAAGVNPLEHFLQFGFYENRAGVDYSL